MASPLDAILVQRALDGADLARTIDALPSGARGWAALLPIGIGVQRLFPTQHFKRPFVEKVDGGAGVTTLDVVTAPPTNKLRIVEIAEAYHDDATARFLELFVRTTIGGTSVDVHITSALNAAANQLVTNNRWLVLNEAQKIYAIATALGVGSHLFTRGISYEIFVGEDVLTL